MLQFSSVNYIHNTVQLSPPSISRTFSSPRTVTLRLLNSISQPTGWHLPWVTCFLPQVAARGKTYFAVCSTFQFSSVAQLCPTVCNPMDCTSQASLSITNSWSLFKLMSIELVMPSNYLILCHPLLLLPSVFPSIRVFSNESIFHISWPKYWIFSFSISPSNEY